MGEYENDIIKKYRIIKISKWKHTKENIVKEMGIIPIGLYMVITNLILSIMSTFFLYKNLNIDKINLQFGNYTLLIWSMFFAIIIFTFFMALTVICLLYYEKYLELNQEVKT